MLQSTFTVYKLFSKKFVLITFAKITRSSNSNLRRHVLLLVLDDLIPWPFQDAQVVLETYKHQPLLGRSEFLRT